MTSFIYGHSKQNKQCDNSKRNDENYYKISPPSCLLVNFLHMSVIIWANVSKPPKCHLDGFSRFCTAQRRDLQTDHSSPAAATAHILCTACMQYHLITTTNTTRWLYCVEWTQYSIRLESVRYMQQGPPKSWTQTVSRLLPNFLQGSLGDRQTVHSTLSFTIGGMYLHSTVV